MKNVTRVESSQDFSQRDSSRFRVTKNRDSSRVIDSSHAITARGARNMFVGEIFSSGEIVDFPRAAKKIFRG